MLNQINLRNGLVIFGLAGLIVGCGEQASEEASEAPEQAAPDAPAPPPPLPEPTHPSAAADIEISAHIAAAVADPLRPEEDTIRDNGRSPAAVLEYYGIEPGMRVLELHGGGYYTRILSRALGDEGSLVAPLNPRTPEDRRAEVAERLAPYTNVEAPYANPEDVDLPDNSVDVAFLMLVYHHYHYTEEEGEVLPALSKARLENVLRMLKPGGIFGVIEHKSLDDATRAGSAALHRVSEPQTIEDITGIGFEFVSASDLLDGHDQDDVTLMWRGNTPRGHSRRLLHTYRKPVTEEPVTEEPETEEPETE